MTDLKEYFKQSYQGQQSFLDNVIFPIFGTDCFESGYNQEVLALYPELQTVAQATGISSVLNVGTIDVDFNPISIFDITVKNRTQLNRNRVGIQQIIRRIMSTYSSAFMIFHYDDAAVWDWRFSFCSKATNNALTDSKRYTFLLGPNQSCRTVADNFGKLLGKAGDIELDDIKAAFDVEALSDEFFGKYKQHYERFVEYVTGKRFVKTGGKWLEQAAHEPHPQMYADFGRDDKRVRDYVKKLLGRIVFLHFLQKKGWLGVPAGKAWGEGDQNFMLRLFECATEAQQEDFLDTVLEPLFAKGLDADRAADDYLFDTQVAFPQGSKVKVPYLNGGLFERDALDEIPTKFPSQFFADLLNFLYQYNFTIDENDPDDAQVGVDPEMLGRIFENLLEDNKDKGAFYTPKEIVRYMCRQSLTAYLCTSISNEGEQQAIGEYVKTYDVAHLGGASSPLAQFVDERLKEVKICDPAIGSGAFPMGMLKELFLCRGAIENFDNAAAIKRHIICNNIYGVDIERGAVDIARLRFWLSLVVDEDEPHTLPNLDFKVMQGNSLLEQYQGADLSCVAKDNVQQLSEGRSLVLFDSILDVYRKELRTMIVQYYSEDNHAKKQSLLARIKENVSQQLQESGINVDLSHIDLQANSQFFLWHTWFGDVLNRPLGCNGFDIVIGNPPYGAKLNAEDKKAFKKLYITTQTKSGVQKGSIVQKGSMDSYTLFIEHGFNLLASKGCLTMIVPISFTSSDALSGVHRLLMNHSEIIRVSSYAVRPQPVFKNAFVNTSIIEVHKTGTHCRCLYSTKMHRKKQDLNLQTLLDNLQFVEVKNYMLFGRIPKIGQQIEKKILKKLVNCNRVKDYILSSGYPIFYRFAGGRYFKVVTNYSNGSSAERVLYFDKKYANAIGCILSSNLSFWLYQIYSDNLNWKRSEIENTPLPPLSNGTIKQLKELYNLYLKDIEINANNRQTTNDSSYNVNSFKEYKIGKSKHIIDRIDDLICPLYGLTQEETEFIKNYEIQYRLSDDE